MRRKHKAKGGAMRFLIIGAGALGGYYGGTLLKGGADVTFLVRPRRAAQLAERGLRIKEPDGEFTTPVKTVQAGAGGGPYDVVFVACKAYGLDAAIDDFAPVLSPDGAVLPVLNGINHIAVLSDCLGVGRVLGGVTLFSVVLTPDGDILVPGVGTTGRTSFGELTGERSARCEEIGAAFAAGGVPITISDNILAEMWSKFCAFAGAAAISTLTRARAGEIAAAPAGAAFVAAALDETTRVTTAEGYPPPAAIIELYRGFYAQIGSDGAPSMLFDVENGRTTEADHIIGDLVRRADKLGVNVPILRAALCNLQIYEARRRAGP
jgi:2-dehydropantoate 2-reductase